MRERNKQLHILRRKIMKNNRFFVLFFFFCQVSIAGQLTGVEAARVKIRVRLFFVLYELAFFFTLSLCAGQGF